jgi:hypothetical protein
MMMSSMIPLKVARLFWPMGMYRQRKVVSEVRAAIVRAQRGQASGPARFKPALKQVDHDTLFRLHRADLAGAFDRIAHDHLLTMLGSFPARGMIWQWLKAGGPLGAMRGGLLPQPGLARLSQWPTRVRRGVHGYRLRLRAVPRHGVLAVALRVTRLSPLGERTSRCWAPFNLGMKRASRAVHGGDEPVAAQDGVGVVVVGVQHE